MTGAGYKYPDLLTYLLARIRHRAVLADAWLMAS